MTHVTFNAIGKTYPNGFEALKPTSFGIEPGEFAVLVGPSGCGKSTLLRMVAGLEEITTGELSIAGRVVNTVDPADRDIAMVFQNYALYPHMTVRKNIGYGLKNRGTARQEIAAKVDQAADLLNLRDYLDRKPSQLSGGQRQRVAMGRAIVRDPALFLFDEPLSNLDAKLRNQMRIEIKALQRRLGVTSIYVTHDQVEAMTMADRIIVMNDGHIEQIGTPSEVYHTPATEFVASFMGAPPMNLMPAKREEGEVRLFGVPIGETDHKGDIRVGVRPEDFLPDQDGTLMMNVDIIEELGAHRLLHGTLGATTVTVQVTNENRAQVGPLPLSIKPGAACLFNKDTGRRI